MARSPEQPADGSTGRLGKFIRSGGDVVERAQERWRRRQAAKRAKVQDLEPVRMELGAAVGQLHFPPGHPHEGIVYVGDPVRGRTYYPAAEFHRRTFERKFSDAIRMLMALGATQLQVEYREGWGDEFAGSLSVSSALHGLKHKTEKRGEGEAKILFQAELSPPAEPVIPDDVPWLEQEPGWEDVVQGRLRYGLTQFSLSVTYYSAFRIDSDFEDKIKVFGVGLGGKLERFERTRWDIQGQFASA